MLPKILLHGSTILTMGALFLSYSSLPPKVAIHFNFAGNPDSWASKSTYLLLGSITLVLIWALFAALPPLMRKIPPEYTNVPNREYWLAPENIEEYRRLTTNYMFFYGGLTQLFFLGVGILVHQAQMAKSTLSLTSMAIFLTLYVGITVIWIIAMIRRFTKTD